MGKRDDEERDEETIDGDEPETVEAQNVVSIAGKALPRALREPEPSAVPLSVFGAVPGGASYWAAHRLGLGGTFETLSYGAPGASAELREWPIAELSEDEVRKRWGAGTYRIEWLGVTPRGGRRAITRGRVFTLRPVEVPTAAAVVAAPSGLGEAFSLATQIMGMIDQNADRKVEGYATMAKLLSARESNGLGAAELTLILQKQAEATKDMVTSIVAPLQRDLAELRSAREDAGAGAAVAAAATLVKGSGIGAWLMNYASANPQVVEKIVPAAIGFGEKFLAAVKPPPPRVVQVQRALPEVTEVAATAPIAAAVVTSSAPPPPSQHAPGSLSGWEQRGPAPGSVEPSAPAPAAH